MNQKKLVFAATAVALLGAGGVLPGVDSSLNEPMAVEAAENSIPEWRANSVNEIEQELNKQNVNETSTYQIRWGDTLSALSVATGLSVDKLASQNNIANPDLIYAGDFLNGAEATTADQTTEVETAEDTASEEPEIVEVPTDEIEPMEPTEEEPEATIIVPESADAEAVEEMVPEPEEVEEVDVVNIETTEEETAMPDDEVVSSQPVAVVTDPETHQESADPFVRPAAGYVSSGYGYRVHPISGERNLHGGIDIAGGDSVVAAQSGTVVRADYNNGWGNYLVIDHGNGLQTLYAHLQNGSLTVAEGDDVSQGQAIGVMGQTGTATGVHLHFEVFVNGIQVDPAPYL